MPYVGRDLQRGNYLKLDDISSSFDGSTTTFNLTSGGNAFFPGSAFSIIVSLGGVIQEPESAFQIDRSQIIFATAPSPNDDFFCIALGVALGVGVPGHNTVNNDQLAKPLSYGDYFRWDSANNRVGINTLLPSTALDVVGSATFSGNVSIGGTLTYEDVANIDAVGLITARAGIQDKTLTEGHVVFTGTNGRLSGDSNLFYDNTNDRLGIGTNNPQMRLEVVGTGVSFFTQDKNKHVDLTAGKIELVRNDSFAYIDFKTTNAEDFDCRIQQADNGLIFYTGGNGSTDEKIRISSAGNLGINQSAPAYKLVINEEDVATGTAHTMLSALNPVVYIDVGNEIDHNIVLKKHETDAQDEVGGLLFASSPDASNYNWAGIKAIEDANAAVTDIAFFTAGSNSSGANSLERMRIHNTNVGIGTTDPAALLHIFQNNSTIGHDIRIEQKDDGDPVLGFSLTGTRAYSMGIDNSDSDKFKFATGSDLHTNTFVTIKSSGEVGIGSDIPTGKLEILKSGTTGYLFRAMAGLTVGNRNYDLKPPSTNSVSDPFSWSTGNSHAFQVDGTERVRIADDGFVGIGTTNPTDILDINSDSASAVTNMYLRNHATLGGVALNLWTQGTYNSPTYKALIGCSDLGGNIRMGAYSNHDLLLLTNNDAKITIKSGGNVGIATNDPQTLLHVKSDDPTLRIQRYNQSAYGDITADTAGKMIFKSDPGGAASGDGFSFTVDNSEKLNIDSDGITVTGEVAASQDYPNFRPTLDLNFVAEEKLDSKIAYRRSGPASFTDEFGKVVLVSGNVPRFDHDPMTGECKGMLVEETRTNYVRVSTNLESEWVAGSGSFARDDSITNPDGSVGAYYHTGGELYHQDIDLLYENTNTITVSLWVKERSGQSGNLDIEIFQQISGGAISMGAFSFDPASQVLGTAPSTYSDGRVEEYPNGWYRVSAKATTASGNFSSTTRFDMQTAEHYVWGMQLEVGSYPTSFIPTNGSIATRGVDITQIDTDEFTEFYNPDEWTMVTHTNVDNSKSLIASPSAVNAINFEGDNNTKKFQTRYVTNSTDNQGYVDVIGSQSGTNYFDLVGGGTGNYNMKTAFAAKYNDVAASHNGATVQTDTSVTMLEGGSIMNIGENPKQFHIKRIMYYPKRLPNSQLVTLTS